MRLFKFGSSLSSYGGIVGALLGIALYKWRHKPKNMMAYLDICAFSLPVGWFFGRVGCAVVHDHPGNPTDFPLAIIFPDGVARHDLGLYEAMWWVVIIAIFFSLHKAKGEFFQRRPGFFLALLPIIYAPVRFSLDFMRKSHEQGGDARYLSLTPGQYASLAALTFGVVFMVRWSKKLTLQMPERSAAAAEGNDSAKAEPTKKPKGPRPVSKKKKKKKK